MKYISTLFFMVLFSASYGQFLNSITPDANPFECQNFTIIVTGDLPASNYTVVSQNATVSGSNLTVRLNFDAPGFGSPTITPFSYVATVPANTVSSSGPYTLIVEAFFTVTGQVTSSLNQPITIGSCCGAVAGLVADKNQYCWDETVMITDSSAGATSIDWYVNNVFDHSGAGDFTLSGLTGANTIKQVVSDGSCSDSSEVTVNVSSVPNAGFTVIQAGSQFTFTATGGTAFIYTWDFGDGNTDQGVLVSHTYGADGNYNVCLSSANSNMCVADSCTTVTFSSIGLEESSKTIRIYPNPASNIVQIEGVATTDIQWYNELGQKIELREETSSHDYIHVYDVSGLPAGLYYIQWADKAEKIIIQ